MPKFAVDAPVVSNRSIGAGDVWELTIEAPSIASQAQPGQFIHLGLPGGQTLLRRPISIADAENGMLRFFYRVVGKGTQLMTTFTKGTVVNCLGPLGHGFHLDVQKPLLVGGGIGIAPLVYLAKRLGGKADILMGGRNWAEMFWPEVFQGSVQKTFITTDDGSLGQKGFTVDLLPEILEASAYDGIFVCGPQRMMEGVARIAASYSVPCQVSLEKHMACGIGACLSCTCESKSDGKRKKVCTDGPVFWAEEVLV